MGKTEKFDILISVWSPMLIILFINSITIFKLNEK